MFVLFFSLHVSLRSGASDLSAALHPETIWGSLITAAASPAPVFLLLFFLLLLLLLLPFLKPPTPRPLCLPSPGLITQTSLKGAA